MKMNKQMNTLGLGQTNLKNSQEMYSLNGKVIEESPYMNSATMVSKVDDLLDQDEEQ